MEDYSIAIDCLERELETLTHNHAITAAELVSGTPTSYDDPEGQQTLRERNIAGLPWRASGPGRRGRLRRLHQDVEG